MPAGVRMFVALPMGDPRVETVAINLRYVIADQFPCLAIDSRGGVRSILIRGELNGGQAVRLGVGQRAQQQCVHQAEDGGVRADTQRQREDDRECETRRLGEPAQGTAERDEGHGGASMFFNVQV